jgi:hypothetical protein
VVAISSPEPTIEADSTSPGPMRRRMAHISTGGAMTFAVSRR